ncbi:MAG: hypothetical protein MHM6MM_003987 [Cercozoa sp. M6MM]
MAVPTELGKKATQESVQVFGFGANSAGQLGLGSFTPTITNPTLAKMPKNWSKGVKPSIVQISAGVAHTLVTDGTRDNTHGQLAKIRTKQKIRNEMDDALLTRASCEALPVELKLPKVDCPEDLKSQAATEESEHPRVQDMCAGATSSAILFKSGRAFIAGFHCTIMTENDMFHYQMQSRALSKWRELKASPLTRTLYP